MSYISTLNFYASSESDFAENQKDKYCKYDDFDSSIDVRNVNEVDHWSQECSKEKTFTDINWIPDQTDNNDIKSESKFNWTTEPTENDWTTDKDTIDWTNCNELKLSNEQLENVKTVENDYSLVSVQNDCYSDENIGVEASGHWNNGGDDQADNKDYDSDDLHSLELSSVAVEENWDDEIQESHVQSSS